MLLAYWYPDFPLLNQFKDTASLRRQRCDAHDKEGPAGTTIALIRQIQVLDVWDARHAKFLVTPSCNNVSCPRKLVQLWYLKDSTHQRSRTPKESFMTG